jgi:Na+/H+ antiporter NhaC
MMLGWTCAATAEPGDTLLDESPGVRSHARVDGPPPIEIAPPKLALVGHPTALSVTVSGQLPAASVRLEVRDLESGALVGETRLESGAEAVVELLPAGSGTRRYRAGLPDFYTDDLEFSLRSIPGWATLLPPLLAILLALLFRQVVPALLCGVWVGAWLAYGGPLVGALRTVDHYVVGALADVDHVSIVVFSLLLGGMVGVVSRSGGTVGLVDKLSPFATSSRRGQLVTWLMGILIFFDDYANTLLVGNTMRPVTDRLCVSREKLAYIVDSTAAPVASVALVSTWIGYEVSLIGDSLREIGSDLDAYSVFLRSLPFNFYPLLALAFGLLVAAGTRDFGPMLTAERRARKGKLLADTAVPLADFDTELLRPPEGKPRRWVNAVAPVLVVLLITFAGLWLTGRSALLEQGDPLGRTGLFRLGFEGMGSVFGAGDSFKALLWASAAGCLAALLLARVQGILSVGEGLAAWINGVRSMTLAIVILILAWSIASICSDLQTSGFMVATLSDHLDPRLLPAIVFFIASITSFATGTSWGTMGILIPLAVPTAYGVAQAAGLPPGHAEAILLGSVSSVLAGAIFGDHCSPISDTTVLSSMASGCDHVDHVRTQLPYAIAVGAVAILVGYLPSGFGLSPFVGLALGVVTLFALLRWLGRPIQT